MGSGEAGQRKRLDDVLAEYLQSHPPIAYEADPVPAYAMSMHTALDADCYFVEAAGRNYFVKLHHGELAGEPDHALAADAARLAAEAGVAPRLLTYLPGRAATVFERAPAGWRTAMRPDFDDGQIRSDAMACLKRWHAAGSLRSSAPVWGFIDTVFQALEDFVASGAPQSELAMPADYQALRSSYTRLLEIISAPGGPRVSLHGEIVASNFLLHNGGGAMLVDFDRAANGDPLWDLAGLALAFDTADSEHADLLRDYAGEATEEAVIRLRANMVVQDLGWGLWARLAHFVSPRSSIEFFKYGETRLARARGRLAADAALFKQVMQ